MLLKIIARRLPGFIKKKKLKELFCLTADAFQSEPPELRGLSFAECLLEYAIFTKEQAEVCLQNGLALSEVKQRLYQNADVFGQKLRKSLRIESWDESVQALQFIYGLMDIDFQCGEHGEFLIRRCFFSQYYSGGVCQLISSLDEGLAAGLSGGGKLSFKQRITDGNSCCQGYLTGRL